MIKSSAKILFYNDNSDSIVAAAGRISTTKGSAMEIYEKSCEKDLTKNIDLIHKIVSSGHTSVLEHAFLNLAFDQVSVFVEQFIIEFRLASFTVKSRRYVDFGNMGYVMPEFEGSEENSRQMMELYRKHMEFLFAEYHNLLEQGIPKEDARFVLPYSFRSNFYCTVNAREFVKIVNEMIFGRGKGYPEIVALGESLRKQCEEKIPFLSFGDGVVQEKACGIKSLFSVETKSVSDEIGDKDTDDSLVTVWDTSTDTPEEIICRAAMLEAGMERWQEIEVKEPALQKEVIREILSHGRKRELEQMNITVLFRGISLAGVTHLVRHRMQSVVVPKYIEICDFDSYILPKTIEKAGLKEKYENVFYETKRVAEQLKKMGMQDCDMIYLLLSGLKVPVLTTMNANELFTFIRLRTCQRAQWEIADHAIELLRILRKKHPVLFSLYGPSCYVTGKCPEGKMSCGEMEKVVRSFGE